MWKKNNEFDAKIREKHTICLCIYDNEFKGNIALEKKGVHWIRIMIHIPISTTVKNRFKNYSDDKYIT